MTVMRRRALALLIAASAVGLAGCSTPASPRSEPVHDPVAGDIYLWPQSEVIAVYYADLGQTVPDPGLIRLGRVDTGLDDLAAAGGRITIRLEPAPAS